MPPSRPEPDGPDGLSPEAAFSLLGNDTRVGILHALWDAFESGTRENDVPFTELYRAVDIDDTGNFSYHLEKLTGPFVKRTDEGYALKQTGINVIRAVVAGTVTEDPSFGPTPVGVACPICDAPIECAYADELMTARCTACEGALRWNDEPGFLFLGLVPPVVIEGRSAEAAFRATVTHTLREIAALGDGVCPHCTSAVETTVDVCHDHDPGTGTLCRACGRYHMAEAWMVCSTCKRSAFPPARSVVLDHPDVTAFYHEHGVEHRFSTWEAAARSFEVDEERLTEDPLEMRFTVPAGDETLRLRVDGELTVRETTA